jgi:hypothetical protein
MARIPAIRLRKPSSAIAWLMVSKHCSVIPGAFDRRRSSDAYYLHVPPGNSAWSQERGSSDYDIQHTFSWRSSYNISAPGSGIWKAIFGNWSTDSIVLRSHRPINYLSSPLFGQSTQMLGASLGSGGQNGGRNPLYQIGGPRLVQLALKLLF